MTPEQKKQLDMLFQQYNATRPCEITGMKAQVVHHFITRRNLATRWYNPNAIPLTHHRHMWAHQNPEAFKEMMIEKKGQEWHDNLVRESNKIAKNIDPSTVIDHMDGKIDHYL